eukprot:13242-Pleurochrysis_carterae.AAC.2
MSLSELPVLCGKLSEITNGSDSISRRITTSSAAALRAATVSAAMAQVHAALHLGAACRCAPRQPERWYLAFTLSFILLRRAYN